MPQTTKARPVIRPRRAATVAVPATPTWREPGTTGRFLVLLPPDDFAAGVRLLDNSAGLKIANAEDFSESSVDLGGFGGADGVFLQELGVAIVEAAPPQQQILSSAAADVSNREILAVEPERFVYATEDWTSSLTGPLTAPLSGSQSAYAQGYRDAMRSCIDMLDRLLGTEPLPSTAGAEQATAVDEREFTWGLQAMRADRSRYTGRGVRVAVLDTGVDLEHPDFIGRVAGAESFIEDETVQDGRGHGTHCAGTVCGPARPSRLPRYGVAPDAELYVGKVLSDSGRGSDGTLLAGLRWAVRQGCAIVSMSLEKGVLANEPFSPVFEDIAQRALNAGTLVIAAAGNKSQRPFSVRPVSHPANCPSIVAVAAVDPRFQIAPFSNAGFNESGGKVDFAAPGVNVLSAWPLPRLYHTLHGTSMATPHISGLAALWSEARGSTGRDLLALLRSNTRALSLPASDAGDGLLQAP
jgi:subtilisin